ncbi:MAG: HD domain-containing protein [Candidatus Diapherotrites archaeon]
MGFTGFALKCLELKDIERTGWLVRKVKKPESVASHSFFLALLCSLYAKEEGLNELKCVRLALAHDLHETICGDICSREFEHEQEMTNAEKKKTEAKAIKKFSGFVPKSKRKALSCLELEFLELQSKEAVFVKDMDMIEMCLQALYYKKNERVKADMSDFFRKTERELKTSTGKRLFTQIKKEFSKLK